MSGYTADDVLERLWNDSADEEDIFGDELDGESDEDYRDESGLHRGEKMARSKRVNLKILFLRCYMYLYAYNNININGSVPYQCSSKVKPGMFMVEFSLCCMVTVVSKFVILDQESQVTQFALIQFWSITGVTENHYH